MGGGGIAAINRGRVRGECRGRRVMRTQSSIGGVDLPLDRPSNQFDGRAVLQSPPQHPRYISAPTHTTQHITHTYAPGGTTHPPRHRHGCSTEAGWPWRACCGVCGGVWGGAGNRSVRSHQSFSRSIDQSIDASIQLPTQTTKGLGSARLALCCSPSETPRRVHNPSRTASQPAIPTLAPGRPGQSSPVHQPLRVDWCVLDCRGRPPSCRTAAAHPTAAFL